MSPPGADAPAGSGGGGIRTPGRVTPSPVFKTGAFNRSATPPSYPHFNRFSRGEQGVTNTVSCDNLAGLAVAQRGSDRWFVRE